MNFCRIISPPPPPSSKLFEFSLLVSSFTFVLVLHLHSPLFKRACSCNPSTFPSVLQLSDICSSWTFRSSHPAFSSFRPAPHRGADPTHFACVSFPFPFPLVFSLSVCVQRRRHLRCAGAGNAVSRQALARFTTKIRKKSSKSVREVFPQR